MTGEFIGRISIESKRRPLHLVREAVGFEAAAELPPQAGRAEAAAVMDGRRHQA